MEYLKKFNEKFWGFGGTQDSEGYGEIDSPESIDYENLDKLYKSNLDSNDYKKISNIKLNDVEDYNFIYDDKDYKGYKKNNSHFSSIEFKLKDESEYKLTFNNTGNYHLTKLTDDKYNALGDEYIEVPMGSWLSTISKRSPKGNYAIWNKKEIDDELGNKLKDMFLNKPKSAGVWRTKK